MSDKRALVDYKKCHPEKCDSGVCAAVLVCSHKLLKKVVSGRIVEIDFATSRILLDEHHGADKPS